MITYSYVNAPAAEVAHRTVGYTLGIVCFKRVYDFDGMSDHQNSLSIVDGKLVLVRPHV